MARDFYPRREADILNFTGNFRHRIGLDPEALGLTSAQSESYALKQARFAELWLLCEAPHTRTTPLLAAKRDAAAALEAETRLLVRIVRAMPFVTDEQLANLGLKPRATRSARIPAPDNAPGVELLWVRGREVRIRLRDAEHAENHGRPRGAGWANVYAHVGKHPPADPGKWLYACSTTRTRATVSFGPDIPAGAQVWLMARWFSPRGQPGPAGIAITAYLQGGVATSPESLRLAA